MRIRCLAHYYCCQQIQTGDLTVESLWSYPLSHNSSLYSLYRVSHKKRNDVFSVACDQKVPYIFTSSNQATPAKDNDTKFIEFD